MAKRLDAKEQRFKEEYLIDLDPKRAAIEAGYSATTAASKAYQWVSNRKVKPHVYDAIAAAQAKRAKRTEITQDRVLEELARIGFSDIRKTVTSTGELVNVQDWDEDTARAIASVDVVQKPTGEVDEEGRPVYANVHKLKAWDKLGALDKLARHLGMFEADNRRDVVVHPFTGFEIERATKPDTPDSD